MKVGMRRPLAALSALLLSAAEARAGYRVVLDARARTAIAEDGLCNLTEAIASVNAGSPVTNDCRLAQDGSGFQGINLDGAGPTIVYELAAGTTIRVADVFLSTPSESATVV